MVIEISPITEADIPGAIDAIQKAFADDPYNLWVFNDRSKVSGCSHSISEIGPDWGSKAPERSRKLKVLS